VKKLNTLRELSVKIQSILKLQSKIVGVKFVKHNSDQFHNHDIALQLEKHRYCQALMKARNGNHVMLNKENISCPAAASAFGFRELPSGLKNGKGLIGFGITKHEKIGKEMFKKMTKFQNGELKEIYLFPLETAKIVPDVVVIEDKVEKLMWFGLAYLNTNEGKRIESSTAILQAACVDATIVPYKKQKINLSYGCYGCRDATDIGIGETIVGFPFDKFYEIAEYVEYLGTKAMPSSRSKKAYSNIIK